MTAPAEVVDAPARGRFELTVDGQTAFVDYRREGDRVLLVHTLVPEAIEGRGVGTRLVRGVLDVLRARGARVVARCPFVRVVLQRHPEYADLVVPA